ncbi:molybdenum cofactor guanylyltransferase [Ningiella sp. W23]|uniref:molybdenum cofactor guanylyltransferase n=1 Tax=Ningiella sp. W23 TaxID=3023715 RepID=UPI003758175D
MLNRKVIGVVLAGGRSSRMGRDKALLNLENQSMLERTVNTLKGSDVDKVVISRNDGAPQHLADILPGKGPLSGIHSMAHRFIRHNLLVVPVDLPFVKSADLQQLIDSGTDKRCNARFKQHNLPYFIHNTPDFRYTLEYTLRCTQCYSVERLSSHFGLLELSFSSNTTLFNTNTPEQWRFAAQHFDNDLERKQNLTSIEGA